MTEEYIYEMDGDIYSYHLETATPETILMSARKSPRLYILMETRWKDQIISHEKSGHITIKGARFHSVSKTKEKKIGP